jgi:PAS domain S-box-containing protein
MVQNQLEREAELRQARVLDAALDAVIEIDEQGLVTEFNLAAEQTFGIARSAAVGRSLETLIIPERFRDAHRTALARLAGTGPCGESRLMGKRVELCAMRADGSEFPVELALVATTGFDGRHRFTGFLRDLTEQKRAEESLALQAHALEQAQFGFVISNPATQVITNVNPAYEAMTGYTADELIGSSGEQLIAQPSQSGISGLRRMLEERGHLTYELQLRRKDGTTLPILASSTTIVTRSGVTMRVSTAIDISEDDRLERERTAAAVRMELLASTGHEFVAYSGNVGPLLDLVARRLSEIIGEGCTVRLLSEDRAWIEPAASIHHADPAILELARHVLGTQRQRVGEGIAGRAAASGVPVVVTDVDLGNILAMTPTAFRPLVARLGTTTALAIPLRSRGRTLGAINLWRSTPGNPYTVEDQRFAQDLADRAGLAIDNAILVETLEQRVAERTTTLEAVNRELESFSFSVSHDLRTPLRAIDGFSRMLIDDYGHRLDDGAQHYLSRIRAGAQRMSQLIDDLLNLARISRVSLATTSVDMSAVAGEVIAEIQRRDPGRAVQAHVAPGISARADARLITILLENLLGNAWKFTAKQATAEIWFGMEAGAFFVRDTGAGFDMAYADKLFTPFQRLHSDRDYEGTGIGLATVHRIVTLHGGRIWAEAKVGGGATFFFTLGLP